MSLSPHASRYTHGEHEKEENDIIGAMRQLSCCSGSNDNASRDSIHFVALNNSLPSMIAMVGASDVHPTGTSLSKIIPTNTTVLSPSSQDVSSLAFPILRLSSPLWEERLQDEECAKCLLPKKSYKSKQIHPYGLVKYQLYYYHLSATVN